MAGRTFSVIIMTIAPIVMSLKAVCCRQVLCVGMWKSA